MDDPFCRTYHHHIVTIKQEPASSDAPVSFLDSVTPCLDNIKKECLEEDSKDEDETYDVKCGVVTSENMCLVIKEEPSATQIDSSYELPVESTAEGSVQTKEEWIENVEEATLNDVTSGNCPAVKEESVEDASGTDCTSGSVIWMASSSEVEMQIKEEWTEDGVMQEHDKGDVTPCDVASDPLDGLQDTFIQAKNFDRTDTPASDQIGHVRRNTGENLYACRFCNYRSIYAGSVNRHERTHTGEKPYVCQVCNLRYGQDCYLKIHMRTHTGEKPYVCEVCKLRFSMTSNLKRHMTTHTGEKRHVCEVCTLRFTLASNLKVHMRTHTGEKPYVCEVCSLRFGQASHLKRHMSTHPYVCEVCNYRFRLAVDWKIHMRTHTGK